MMKSKMIVGDVVMTLRHLEIFRTVCRYESITRGAEELHMTQPAVSIAVGELEAYYQVKLFDRMNRRIFLTQEGKILLQYADTVLKQMEEAAEVLRERRMIRQCRIGVNVTVDETVLEQILFKIRNDTPEIDLQVLVHRARTLEKMLMNNEIDLAIMDTFSPEHRWETKFLYRQFMVPVCSKEYPVGKSLTLSQLSKQKLILRERGSGSRACVDAAFEQRGCSVAPVAESVSSASLLRLAAGGMGIAIVPETLAQKACQDHEIRMITVEEESFSRNFYLISNHRKYRTNGMRSVENSILTLFLGNNGDEPADPEVGNNK